MIRRIVSFFKKIFGFGAVVLVPQPIPTDVGASTAPVVGSSTSLFIPLRLYGLDQAGRSQKFSDAIKYSDSRLRSKEFKDWFMAFKFTQLGEHEVKTNEQLFAILMRPVKFNYSVINGTIFNRGVIGYNQDDASTEGGDVFTYSNWYDGFETPDLSNQLTHEIVCHGNGFSHDFRYSVERDSSLPYAVGNFVGGVK